MSSGVEFIVNRHALYELHVDLPVNKTINTIRIRQSFNFDVFRCGTPALPRVIDAGEFDQLVAKVDDKDTLLLIEKWYKRDDNAVPSEYVLQPISVELPEFIQVKSEF